MNRSLYGERDYAFGQRILTLRTQIGLTQTSLAERLHISRRAVTEWEAGSSYPTAEHLQQLIALGVRASAFPAEREAEEIRALWKAARQKVLLDEAWLASLFGRTRPALTLLHPVPLEASRPGELPAAQPPPGPRLDWGEALAVPTFYDREQELATLTRWVVEEGCRMVSALGMGGMGKSALVVRAMQQLAEHFEVVIFRSLRDAPSCEALLESCLSVLAPEPLAQAPQSREPRLSQRLEELRNRRVLLVLDNLEVLLEEGEVLGRPRPGFEAYGHLLRQVAQTAHQSCLLLTSREKPAALRALEGSRMPVRSLPLSGLNAASCEQLLAEHEVMGSPQERARLGAVYEGNPLALNIVAETIADLFGGQIDPFLAGGTVVFGSITELLDEQWARLSPLEQTVLYWLAILRESAEEAQGYGPANLVALLGLLRGDLRGVDLSHLTLRGVYLQGLELQDATLSRAMLRECVFTETFDAITAVAISRSGQYWAAASQRGEVQVWREAGQTLHLVWQAHTDIVWSLAFSPDERRLASGSLDNSVKLWDVESRALLWTGWQTKGTICLAFAPDGDLLASGGSEATVRLWDPKLGTPLQELPHPGAVLSLAWSPDGRLLATGSFDHTIRLWDGQEGSARVALQGHSAVVQALAFPPDSRHLLSGSDDGTLRLWDVERGESLRVMQGYTASLYDLDWSPDGTRLASAGADTLVTLWDVAGATLPRVLRGHRWSVYGVGWSPDGGRLASSGWDNAIRLWDPATGTGVQVLRDLDHPETAFFGVAWSPDGQLVACGTYQRGLQVWDVAARSLRWADRAYVTWIRRVAWSPDGTRLVGGDEDGHVSVWNARGGTQLLRLAGHHGAVTSVAWSPDGSRLASGGGGRDAGELVVWDAHSGERHPAWEAGSSALAGHPGVVSALTWAPSGELVVSGGSDGRLRWWKVQSGECVRVREAHQGAVQVLKVTRWPVVGMTGSLRSGTCRVASLSARCAATAPTSD